MYTGRERISVKGLWKVFGKNPERVMADGYRTKTKAEIQSETGSVVALRDVSFDVEKGETFVVMGLSGSGKSTLIRCLIRLNESTWTAWVTDDAAKKVKDALKDEPA